MILSKVVAILSFVIVVGSALPEVSRAHKHVVLQKAQGTCSLMLARLDEFMGPVLRSEELSQREQQS